MSTPLTVHNAEITTATVEIRTLTISGKQVTLAVFRQLVEEQPPSQLPWDAFWGRVNYCPTKKCQEPAWDLDSRRHHHVVWQSGSELRRTTIYATPKELDFDQDRKARLLDRFQRFGQLPQLFIAV